MQQHARLITWVASAGLGLVFVALIVCTVWGAVTMKHAAATTLAAVTLSERYELLERQLSTEASMVRVHGFDPAGSGWNEERPAAIETEATIDTIAKLGGAKDQAIAKATTADHDRYLDVLLILFSEIDNGAPNVATTFKRSLTISERMLTRVDLRAAEQHQSAVASLANLGSTQALIVRTILGASVVGVGLLGACILTIAMYRRTLDEARKAELERLAQASLTDVLTGLGNHRAYQNDLERELALVGRHGGTLTLALIDIDNFKEVNDCGGHLHGDAVLAALGELLRSLRKYDRSFRLGGDEFGVILPLTNTQDALAVMERLRQDAPGCLYGSTITIGIASIAGFGSDGVLLRAKADAALYAAKRQGRNSVLSYDDARSRALVHCAEKERSLRRLIDDGEIEVVFQPIWDVASRSPLGFEALVRPAAGYGLAGPQEAFDIAERMGLAAALDAVCLRAILTRAAEIPPAALLFINIVPETLDSMLLANRALVDLVVAAGLTPGRVVIELTERSMLRFDVIVREAKRLQSFGFRLALDDTGAGNAGLDVLRHLRVEFVKIDRGVIVESMTNPIARAIVTGIVDIARAMDGYIIAEGIETFDCLDFVCSSAVLAPRGGVVAGGAQGYLLGRPHSAPWNDASREVAELLDRARENALLGAVTAH